MKKYNISIILLDTLRLDVFKEIDSKMNFLEGFERLEECIAPAPWTLPSHASLFTGMYPSEHGAHETKEIKSLDIERIKLRKRTFIEDLNELGYNTYAISANPYVSPIYGFDAFNKFIEETYFVDVFGSIFELPERAKKIAAKYRQIYGNDPIKVSLSLLKEDKSLLLDIIEGLFLLTPKEAIKKAKAKYIDGWPIEKGGKEIVKKVKKLELKKPSFLFINMMEAHDPYIGIKKDVDWSTPFMKKQPSKEEISKWKELYYIASKKAINYADSIAKHLLDTFGEDQIIIVTSDHGQEFNEHGFIGHWVMLHDEIVKIPFLLKMPKEFEIKRSGKYISLVNVKNFLFEAIKGSRKASEKLYSKEVYSESFGMPANITMIDGIDKAKLMRSEKYRIRIFK